MAGAKEQFRCVEVDGRALEPYAQAVLVHDVVGTPDEGGATQVLKGEGGGEAAVGEQLSERSGSCLGEDRVVAVFTGEDAQEVATSVAADDEVAGLDLYRCGGADEMNGRAGEVVVDVDGVEARLLVQVDYILGQLRVGNFVPGVILRASERSIIVALTVIPTREPSWSLAVLAVAKLAVAELTGVCAADQAEEESCGSDEAKMRARRGSPGGWGAESVSEVSRLHVLVLRRSVLSTSLSNKLA